MVKVISLPYIFQVLYVLCFTRPRYQVSVYRTIGPLVLPLIKTSDTDFSAPIRARVFIVCLHLSGGQVCRVSESLDSYFYCCLLFPFSSFLSFARMLCIWIFCQRYLSYYTT